jgi:hypothetical protein
LVLLEPDALLLALESLEPEAPLEDEGELGVLDWSLLELLLEEGAPGVLEDALPLLSLLFIARLPVEELDEPDGLVDGDDEAMPDEPDEPDEPDCESRESLPRSQAESPKVAASAAARAVRTNLFCTMSTIS